MLRRRASLREAKQEWQRRRGVLAQRPAPRLLSYRPQAGSSAVALREATAIKYDVALPPPPKTAACERSANGFFAPSDVAGLTIGLATRQARRPRGLQASGRLIFSWLSGTFAAPSFEIAGLAQTQQSGRDCSISIIRTAPPDRSDSRRPSDRAGSGVRPCVPMLSDARTSNQVPAGASPGFSLWLWLFCRLPRSGARLGR